MKDKGLATLTPRAASLSIVEPSSSINANVGIDGNVKQILERVTSHSKELQVIPIVGMGGIGKTTLAKTVYEKLMNVGRFDLCFWVTISQEYNTQTILRGFLPREEQNVEQNVETLIVAVYKSLYNRRFLIVLDDMWNVEAWEGVMRAIPDRKNSSRVIVTTRPVNVATKIDSSSSLHQMQLLQADKSWDLLRVRVYGEERCPREFEHVGKMIAENCKGLPLAIVVVAGLLKSNKTYDYWEDVARNVSEAALSNAELLKILSLSYSNLPPHLRSCFLYMGAFPEDFHISASNLIWFWIAEGFVDSRAPRRLEEIGEEYLDDLVERNLVLVTENKYEESIRTCSIHDVLRELCLTIAKDDKFLQHFTGRYMDTVTFQNVIMSQRRLSVSTKTSLSFPEDDTCDCSTFIRSLLFIDCPPSKQVRLITARFRLLKVLNGICITMSSELCHLFELTNLKYLHFYHLGPLVIPGSISKLQKLETSIISQGKDPHQLTLPVDIWEIPKLRHILLSSDCILLFPLVHEGLPVLENLQTISWVKNFKLTKGVVQKTPNLKKLRVTYKDGQSSRNYAAQYCLNNLADLNQLEELDLVFFTKVYTRFVPTDVVFPQNLNKLTLVGTSISWEDISLVGLLPHLQVLKLLSRSVKGSTWEPNDDEFLQLKYLEMAFLNLKYWNADDEHFPCLEKLILVRAYFLEEIPLCIGSIDTLEKLIVKGCNDRVNESAKRIQEEQKSFANDALEVVIQL